MTKEEAKQKIAKQKIAAIIEKVESLQDDLITLDIEAYDDYLDVKPYDGMDELTPSQYELERWFYDLQKRVGEANDAFGGIKNYFALLVDKTTQEG